MRQHLLLIFLICVGGSAVAQSGVAETIRFADAATAHAKNLPVQAKYRMPLFRYPVEAKKAVVPCFSPATGSPQVAQPLTALNGLLGPVASRVEGLP